MLSTRKKKNNQKRQFSQLNETSNDYVLDNNINASALGDETLGPQTKSCVLNFLR